MGKTKSIEKTVESKKNIENISKKVKKMSKTKSEKVVAPVVDSDEDTKVAPVAVSKKEKKKSKKIVEKKVESSSSSSSSSSEEEATPAPAVAATKEDSSSSDSSSSSDEDTPAPVVAPAAPVVEKDASSSSSDSSSSDSEKETTPVVETAKANAKAADSSDSSSSDSSDEEDTTAAKVTKEADSSSDSSSDSSDDETTAATTTTKRKAEETQAAAEPKKQKQQEVAAESGEDTTVFVGNLSWNVTEDLLATVFADCGSVVSTRIITDRETGRAKGFGYVEFADAASAKNAIALTGTEVDGREIRVDISAPKPKTNNASGGRVEKPTSAPSAILFMGNLSFNVTEDEIRSTFGTHGQILSCRFPTDRETGAFKGFGYLEFSSAEEAKNAVDALNGENIAGRAIRLDYSQPRDNAAGGGDGGRGGGRGGSRPQRGGGGRGGGGRGGGGRGGGRGAPRGGAPRGRGFGVKPSGTRMTFD